MALLDNAPRIYNLHPLLAGPIAAGRNICARIAAMGFDWVYVNAFWEPGASGSIYAVRDPLSFIRWCAARRGSAAD